MSLPPRYAIAKKGQVDKYSKIFGLFGNLAIRVCQGPSTCTRTFKHGDPGYEVEHLLACPHEDRVDRNDLQHKPQQLDIHAAKCHTLEVMGRLMERTEYFTC
jgi:hypothetical protein